MEMISTLLYNIIPFILVITIIVFIHEFGHFWVARKAGVKVEIFSIGFGKELFGFNDQYGTRWKFCLVPMGGYVKMFGDKSAASQTDEDLLKSLTPAERKIAFPCKSLLAKAAIVVAGPMANYLFSALIFTIFFNIYGYPNADSMITKIMPNSPASKAEVNPGDVIIAIDEQKVSSFNDIKNIMALNLGNAVNLVINRNGNLINKQIKPEKLIEKDILGNDVPSYKLGIITDHVVLEQQNLFTASKLAIGECYNLSVMTLKAMGQMILGKRGVKELGGPIKIAQYSAESAKQGLQSLLWFMALLSVNLGLINLMPVPTLDGGHLLVYLVEAALGKKIANKIQNYGFQIGFILIIMLTIFVTLNDLHSLNLFGDKG
jgi:regulator of sigma E protease